VLVTLYDPLRLAEEMALLDVHQPGAASCWSRPGLSAERVHMMDRDFGGAWADVDFVIETC